MILLLHTVLKFITEIYIAVTTLKRSFEYLNAFKFFE